VVNGATLIGIDAVSVSGAEGVRHDTLEVAWNRAEIDANSFIPDYLEETYYWAYLNPHNVRFLDRKLVV